MAKNKLSRREREKLNQRREMLDAALQLFSEKGYHDVSMQEIAEKSEFAIGTLYKFFESKEKLYETIHLESSALFHKTLMESINEGSDEVEKLENYVKAAGVLFKEHGPLIRLYLSAYKTIYSKLDSEFELKIKSRHQESVERLSSIIAEGMEKQCFNRIAEPFHLATALHSATTAFLFQWLDNPENNPFPDNPYIILNIFFKGLLKS